MAITWNAEADAKLLVGIIATSNSSIDFEKVAEFMGQDCTVSALKHRVQRIKEKAGLANSKGATPKSLSTPKTKRSTSMKAAKSTPKRKSALTKGEQIDEKIKPEKLDHDDYLA